MAAHSRAWTLPAVIALGFVLAGCASSPSHYAHYGTGRPHYTVAPYKVNGVWYYPKVDYHYDETGTASWYGPGFDHRATADGEIYDMNDLSAAHKTLPLPSVVAVTNLQNGRELRLRVNDRGPFVGDRLIDLSRRAAQLLGFERIGTAQVRVRVLKEESMEVAAAAMRGEMGAVAVAAAPRTTQVAMASPPPQAPPPAPPPVVAPPAALPAQQIAMAPPEPAPAPPQSPPPAAAVASGRSYWPSLIAPAHAETLHRAPVGTRRMFVQAGTFAVPENAQRVRARIAALGSAEIDPVTVNGTAMYRVRLGPLASETEARRLLTRVVDSGYPGARLVGD